MLLKLILVKGHNIQVTTDALHEINTISCSFFSAYCEKLQDFKLTVKSSMDKEMYEDGEVIEYVCNAPGASEGRATCVNSTWTKTVECPGRMKC